MNVLVLGPIEVEVDGDRSALTAQSRRLIGLLVARLEQDTSPDLIAEELGLRSDGHTARMAVSRLRRVLGERITTRGGGYRLRLEADDRVDATEFERLVVAAGETASATQRLACLRAALGWWRGPAFSGLDDMPSTRPMCARLEGLRSTATEDLAETLLDLDRADEAILVLEAMSEAPSYRERPVALTMRALAASGRVTEALRAYQRFRIELRDDVGVTPSVELRNLEARLLADAEPAHVDAHAEVRRAPSGTVTFMLTDIEGSSRHWVTNPRSMADSLALHDRIVRAAIERNGGYVFTTAGDSFAAAFARTSAALDAVDGVHADLGSAGWPGPALRVRIGVHIGEADERDGDYFGTTVNITARIAAAGHGGQTLISDAVRATARVQAVDLGVHRFPGIDESVRLYQIGAGQFPALRVDTPPSSNLPVRPTSLFGRHADIANVRASLAEHRCVTLSGFGGAGKTRVALAVGEAELSQRGGGVWFADLTTVTTDVGVPDAIATAVRLTLRDGDPTEQVVGHLADKRALVILDNCEHVIDGCAQFAHRFLRVAGDAVLLTTSREALAVDGEHVVAVGTLPTSGSDSPAVDLFTTRAREAGAELTVDGDTAATIESICRHLDGVPLAIELAAARAAMLTLSELEAALADRFALLIPSRRRQPGQRTLEQTLDWSYDLLSDDEQHLLRTLGVFIDGFDIEAIAAVAGTDRTNTLATVGALTAKNLVARSNDGRQRRFRLLETVKAYAESRLDATGETKRTRDRHLRHYHQLATAPGVSGMADLRHGVALRPERSNLTAAYEWATATDRWTLAAELIATSYPAYIFDNAGLEARRLINAALAAPDIQHSDLDDELRLAVVMTSVWISDWSRFEHETAHLSRSPNPATSALGHIAHSISTPVTDATASLAELELGRSTLEVARATTPDEIHPVVPAIVDWAVGRIAAGQGDYESGLAGCLAYLAACRAVDFFPTPTSRATKHAATCQILVGQPAAALETVHWLQLFDATIFNVDDITALALIAQGRLLEACPIVRAHAQQGLTGRTHGQVCDSLIILAALAQAEGDDDRARQLLSETGAALEPGVIIYSQYLAAQLGIERQHIDRQRLALTIDDQHPDGPNGTHRAAIAVRTELTRREWLSPR